MRELRQATQGHKRYFHPSFLALKKKTLQNFDRLSQEDFFFDPVTRGVDLIRDTLELVNDLIRLSQMYRVPFNSLYSGAWAVIRMEIKPFTTAVGIGHFEMIDIPGVLSGPSKFHWEALAQEALRKANVIIALVSGADLNEPDWHKLPTLVSAGSNIRPTAVVLTKTDQLPFSTQDERKRMIVEEFFPESTMDGVMPKGTFYIEGSAYLGPLLAPLAAELETCTELPPFELLLERHGMAMGVLFNGRKEQYLRFTISLLREYVDESISNANFGGMRTSILRHITRSSRSFHHIEEARGLRERTTHVIRTLEQRILRLGLSSASRPDDERQNQELQKRAIELRAQWRAAALKANDDLLEVTSSRLRPLFVAHMEKALKAPSHFSVPRHDTQSSLTFPNMHDIRSFLEAFSTSLFDDLPRIKDEFVNSIGQSPGDLFRSYYTIPINNVVEFDPKAELELNHLFSVLTLPEFSTPRRQPLELKDLVERREAAVTFESVRKGILARLARGSTSRTSTMDTAESLPTLGRALLNAVAFISYLVLRCLPRYISSETYFQLDVDGLRGMLMKTVFAPWVDDLSATLRRSVETTNGLGQGIVESAIQEGLKANTDSLNRQHQTLSVLLDENATQRILCGYCNLVASREALDALVEYFERLPDVD